MNDPCPSPENATCEPVKQIYKVFSIVEKPGDQKNVWLDIGVARKNRDDSITCKLDCLPLNGTIQLRLHDSKTRSPVHNSSPKTWQREGY